MVEANAMTGTAYLRSVTKTDTRTDRIAAGRDWLRGTWAQLRPVLGCGQ